MTPDGGVDIGPPIVTSFVLGSQTVAAALCAPPLALVIARAAQRRLPMPNRLAQIGLTMFLTGAAHAVLLAVIALGADDSVDLGEPIAMMTSVATEAVGAIGLVVWIAAMVTSRPRPADWPEQVGTTGLTVWDGAGAALPEELGWRRTSMPALRPCSSRSGRLPLPTPATRSHRPRTPSSLRSSTRTS